MPLVLDATPGGPASNSYGSRAAANAYFEGRVGAEAWLNATDDVKDQALAMATARLDQEEYDGVATSMSQRLQWPRYGLTDANGWTVDAATIPRAVQEASFEQALVYVQTPEAANTNALAQFESVRVGPIAVTPSRTGLKQDALCAAAVRLLRRWLLTGAGSFRVERA